jgi:hypothetical protein
MSARRFFVLQPSNRYTGAQTAEARAYFDRILAVDPKTFAHYLYNRDIAGFESRRVPVTEALTRHMTSGGGGGRRWRGVPRRRQMMATESVREPLS